MKNTVICLCNSLTLLLSLATVWLLAYPADRDSRTVEASTEIRPSLVLTYHLISDEIYGSHDYLFVRPSEFERQLAYLRERGFSFVFAEDVRKTNTPSVALTFDDGYEDNYTEMFPIIKKYEARATIFLITDRIGLEGYLTVEQIREMSESGLVSFQSHTAHHVDLTLLNEDELRADFAESVSIIEGITGKTVEAVSYPNGRYSSLVCDVASSYFKVAFTTDYPPQVPLESNMATPRFYVSRGGGISQLDDVIALWSLLSSHAYS